MKPKSKGTGWADLAIASSVILGASAAAYWALKSGPPVRQGLLPFDERDVEAAARMLASENPSGSEALHVEQVYTQVRQALRSGISLYERITAGSGWGEQGERAGRGGVRPVATGRPAPAALRERARAILEGAYVSRFEGATKFFEPETQERAFAIAEIARMKRQAGLPLEPKEERLLKYKRDAAGVREGWEKGGGERLGVVDGVEFWS